MMAFRDMFNGFRDKFRKQDLGEGANPEEQKETPSVDEPNPFFAGNQTINLEQAEDPNKRGRRLKGKAVVGVISLAAVVAVAAIASNMLSQKPIRVKEQQQRTPQAGNKSTNPADNVPGSYGDLAKYRAEQARLAKERELANKKAKEAVEKSASKEEKQSFARKPTPPSVPSPPSVPDPKEQARVRAEEERKKNDYEAKRSAVAFSVGGQAMSIVGGNYLASARSNVDMSSSYIVQAGTVIPATLLNGLDTRMSGDVVAQIRQDVYDSLTGQHLLIPQGSRLLGRMEGGNGRRVGVKFNRIVLPDGTNIALPDQYGTDKAGYAGLKDKYDNHDEGFFRGAIISGVMSYIADKVDDELGNNAGTDRNGNAYGSAINDTVGKITDRIMDRADKSEQPNSIIRPGFQFNVFINQDLNAYEYRR